MALVTVAANKRHLVDPNGNPFFALGINYAGYHDRAWKMWESGLYDPQLIARDFLKAQNSGFNTIRLFVHPALGQDISKNNFSKLDQTLSLAQSHKLMVLLTLNDAHNLNLASVAALDAKIVARYKDVSTIFAYDLENEPVFYNLVAAIYPPGYEAPVHTGQLVNHYGERVSRTEALDLQRNRKIPGHLSADHAYYYINALRLFLEYSSSVTTFINQGKGTLVDYMLSNESQRWHTLIGVLDGTVNAWLRARMEPLRAAGCRHLLTVGWNWMHFAALPANRKLDFQEYHNYPSLSLAGFNSNLAHLQALQRAFSNHPIIFGEFGWSNQSGQNPATSQPVSEDLTALYEIATHAYLRANNFAGAFKWVLNDLTVTHNPYEASFGIFKVADQPKPIRDLILQASQNWLVMGQPGSFAITRDVVSGLAYRFDLPQHLAVGGHTYQDDTIGWQSENIAHCFIKKDNNQLYVEGYGTGQLSLESWELLPAWDRTRETDLFRIFSNDQQTRQQTFAPGEAVSFLVRSGARYTIKMGAAKPVEPPPLPTVEPKPGEHVVVLADANESLQAALIYIRRFAPDFTFAPQMVAGRWAYVTVVATPAQISDATLDEIRGAGAIIVERVVGNTFAATKAQLDGMAARGQRFLSAVTPPQGEPPPPDPSQPPPPPVKPPQTYVVQPGDTLGRIAQKFYGQFTLWPLIFEANRDKISDPALIRVGMELLIPPKP